jgi:hypothetical protein
MNPSQAATGYGPFCLVVTLREKGNNVIMTPMNATLSMGRGFLYVMCVVLFICLVKNLFVFLSE